MRTFRAILLAAALFLPAFAADSAAPEQAVPFPVGCWNLNANGSAGQLCIPSLNSDGTFLGHMVFSGYSNVVTGLWSSGAQQLTFIRMGVSTNPYSYQSLTGYLFPTDGANPAGPQMLAGTFSVFEPSGGSTPARNQFGWTASSPETTAPR